MLLAPVKPATTDGSDSLPFFAEAVPAGFPSPASGWEEKPLNLHDLAVARPASTFFLRVQGTSMIDARIHDGDVLVVDRAEEPQHGSIVIASINGEFTVKQLRLRPRPYLMAMNPDHPPIYFDPDADDVQVWGVVTYSLMRHFPCSD